MAVSYVPDMMDQRIVIQRAEVSRDAFGGETLTWADWKIRWAAVNYSGGGESQAAQKETASMTAVFVFRYADGLTEKDRISYKGGTYDITAIIPNGRTHFHTVETEFRR